MHTSPNIQPQNPTYFLVCSGGSKPEFMNTSRLTPLREDGGIPRDIPRFYSGQHMRTVRHMVALIGCEFIEDPIKEIKDIYHIETSKQGGVAFRKISKNKRALLSGSSPENTYYLKNTVNGAVFALIKEESLGMIEASMQEGELNRIPF